MFCGPIKLIIINIFLPIRVSILLGGKLSWPSRSLTMNYCFHESYYIITCILLERRPPLLGSDPVDLGDAAIAFQVLSTALPTGLLSP